MGWSAINRLRQTNHLTRFGQVRCRATRATAEDQVVKKGGGGTPYHSLALKGLEASLIKPTLNNKKKNEPKTTNLVPASPLHNKHAIGNALRMAINAAVMSPTKNYKQAGTPTLAATEYRDCYRPRR